MTKKTKKLVYTNKNKKQNIKKRKISKTKKNKNMKGGGVFGGNVNKKVEKIMIDNLCKSTNNGVSLNDKDILAATNVSNLCNNRDLSKSKKIIPEFNSSGFFGTIVGVALMPFKIGANVIGNIAGYRNEPEQKKENINVGTIPLNQLNNGNIANISNNNRIIQKN